MDPLIKDLLQIFPKNRVKAKLIDVISYASDAGFYHLIPKVVVQPENVEEVQQHYL